MASTSDEVTPTHSDTEYFTLTYLIILYIALRGLVFSTCVLQESFESSASETKIFFWLLCLPPKTCQVRLLLPMFTWSRRLAQSVAKALFCETSSRKVVEIQSYSLNIISQPLFLLLGVSTEKWLACSISVRIKVKENKVIVLAEDLTSRERQATFQRKSFTRTKRKIQGNYWFLSEENQCRFK